MIIRDMPKLLSPFIRETNANGDYVVTDKVEPSYEWVKKHPQIIPIEE